MHAYENIRFTQNIAMHKRKVRFAVYFAPVLDGLELTELRPDLSLRFSTNKLFGLRTVTDQLRHRDHLQPVLPAEFGQFGNASHSAVGNHDLADDTTRVQSSTTGEADGGFSP